MVISEVSKQGLSADESLGKFRILYVEDTKDDQIILRRLLEKKSRINFELITVSDGFEGLKRVSKEDFDLIILDYRLPGMTGLDFLERLKKMNITTPVIFVTGKGDERIAVEAMKRGARDYIVKDEEDFGRLIKAIEEAALEASLPKSIDIRAAIYLAGLFSAHEILSGDEIGWLLEQSSHVQLESLLSALDELVKAGFAEAKPLYSAVACPFCGSLKPNLLLQCPQCGSSQLIKGEALEHMNCGGLDFKFSYQSVGGELICPKCGKKLRQLGVDYRRVSALYKCSNGHFFSLPTFNFKCFGCGRTFDIDEASLKTIYQYRLTRKGRSRLSLALKFGVDTPELEDKVTIENT
ncbi:MAG: response regulator [Candidatus Bathyarchaeia archaeon]|nr:response regulator [Candidatus Bathyarchaeota archaeon]